MPIYAYRCTACGHAQDVLQKLSDPVLTECPACKAATFAKQLTAAGFQLKGSGWYVTDFRDGNKPAATKGDASPMANRPSTRRPLRLPLVQRRRQRRCGQQPRAGGSARPCTTPPAGS
jgi:putative FmdB family regulatory protein